MKDRKVRAKRVRREAREKAAAQKAVRQKQVGKPKKAAAEKVVIEPDEIDEYDEKAVKAMASNTPEVRFRHASYFTDDEDKIIAASLKSRVQLYKVAASLKCAYNTLKKHIDNTPVLAEIAREAREIECGELREAVDDLVKMRHPQVVMWRAKQLMPQEYGEAMEAEEDDTRIVIGAIPDDLLAEADRALELANAQPPDVGLSALLDPRAKEAVEKAVSEKKKTDKKKSEKSGGKDGQSEEAEGKQPSEPERTPEPDSANDGDVQMFGGDFEDDGFGEDGFDGGYDDLGF